MALSPLPPPNKTSAHSHSNLKQKRELELKKKKKNRYLAKKPTGPVCKAREVKKFNGLCSSLPKEEEENALQLVKCNEQKVDSISQLCGFVDKNPLALQRAHEVQDNLEQDFPSFVKLMLKSHVTGGFWLGFPRPFCLKNLPKHDETIMLVGENGEEYNTKYLAGKNGLSGGWRGFSISHNLLEGDVLVFQLIKEWKFKVFIVRASGLTEIDGAISLLNLHVEPKPILTIEEEEPICEVLMQENAESPSSCSHQANGQGNGNPENLGSDSGLTETDGAISLLNLLVEPKPIVPIVEEGEKSICEALMQENAESPSSCSDQAYRQGNGNHHNLGSEILDKIGYLESAVDLKDVKSFEAFKILVDGFSVDSVVDEHIRTKYYELCRSQQCYLHEHLTAGLNFKLVGGIISETVNVADAIRASKLITPLGYLETWDSTLKSFDDLGMSVGFLRERLKNLKRIPEEQKKKVETKKRERTLLEEEIRSLKQKLLNAERAVRSVDDEMEALKVEDKKLELTFKETASAPW